jgi:hypothetical protein
MADNLNSATPQNYINILKNDVASSKADGTPAMRLLLVLRRPGYLPNVLPGITSLILAQGERRE